ncbi:hypothetical protein ACFX2I_012541 [Malus domestica]
MAHRQILGSLLRMQTKPSEWPNMRVYRCGYFRGCSICTALGADGIIVLKRQREVLKVNLRATKFLNQKGDEGVGLNGGLKMGFDDASVVNESIPSFGNTPTSQQILWHRTSKSNSSGTPNTVETCMILVTRSYKAAQVAERNPLKSQLYDGS